MRALRMRKRGDGVVLAPTDPDRPRRRPRVSAGFAVAGDSGRADGSRPQLHPLIGSSLRRLSRVDRLSAGDSHPGGRRHRDAAMRGRGLRRRWPLLLAPAPALADGDPASDYLPLQGYYTPYAGVSKPLTDALAEVVKETRAAGYPIKVAVIASPTDLGSVPNLFGQPQQYAEFLG